MSRGAAAARRARGLTPAKASAFLRIMRWSRPRARSLALSVSTPLLLGALLGTLAPQPTAAAPEKPPAQAPPLLPEPIVHALAAELSGSAAKHTVQELTLFHRMRGSRGLRSAAEAVLR